MQVNKSDINASPSLCCRFLTESLLFHSPLTPIPERWLWNRSPCTGLYDFDLQDEQLPTELTSFSAIYGELRLLFEQRINFNLESISVPTLSRDLSRFIELVIEKGVLVPMALHSVVWKGWLSWKIGVKLKGYRFKQGESWQKECFLFLQMQFSDTVHPFLHLHLELVPFSSTHWNAIYVAGRLEWIIRPLLNFCYPVTGIISL